MALDTFSWKSEQKNIELVATPGTDSLLHNINCKLLDDNHVWTDYSTQKYRQSTSEWTWNSMLPLFHIQFPKSFEFPDDRYFNSHLLPCQCLIITGCLNEHCKSLSQPPRDSTLRGTKQVMVVVVYTTPAKPCSFIEEHPLLSTQSDILLAVFKTSDGKVLILSSSFAPFSKYQGGCKQY